MSQGRMQEAVRRLLEAHAEETRARRLRVRTELDESWQREATDETIEAIRTLLRLVFATIPDGCEVYVGSARSTSAVARLEAGLLTVRWQVMGEVMGEVAGEVPGAVVGERSGEPAGGAREGRVATLHPRPGNAWQHVRSSLARSAREAFARLGWCFELEVLTSGHEIVARASVDAKAPDR